MGWWSHQWNSNNNNPGNTFRKHVHGALWRASHVATLKAVLHYQGGTVNRPKIPEKGLMFDVLVQADQDVLEDNNTEFTPDRAFNADADVDKLKQTESIIDQASDADADVDQPNQKMMAQEAAVQMADKPAMVATVPIEAPRRSQRERRPPTRFQ
jgi:hypothetical protein